MDWAAIWAVAWRYFLLAPAVVPLGATVVALAIVILIGPPLIAVLGLFMMFGGGSWIAGSLVFIASSVATYFLWRGAGKHLDRFDYPDGL